MHYFETNQLIKKDRKKLKEIYSIKEMREDGNTFILRFKNNLLQKIKIDEYPYQIGIAVPLKSGDRYPNKQENEQLLVMEQIIENEFQHDDLAIFTGTIMGGGMKEFILYTNDSGKSSKLFEQLRGEIAHHELQCIIREDPKWQVYKTYSI